MHAPGIVAPRQTARKSNSSPGQQLLIATIGCELSGLPKGLYISSALRLRGRSSCNCLAPIGYRGQGSAAQLNQDC